MQTLIRKIRSYLNMSPADLAGQLNVTATAVNRWENSRTIPNRSAQLRMYELCKEKSVPVYDMALERIREASGRIRPEADRIILYHGSKSGIEGSISPKSRKQCDFGSGFYMGTEPSQALTLICDYDRSKLYIVSICADGLACLDVAADIDWAMLVAYNRGRMEKIKGSSFYNKYREMAADKDLIIGSIANDRMFYVIDNFFIGNITDAALVHSLSALRLGRQYVTISQKGCDAVRVESEVSLSFLERLFMKEAAEENRSKGVSLANDICRAYRREGRFFDEILDEAKAGGKL